MRKGISPTFDTNTYGLHNKASLPQLAAANWRQPAYSTMCWAAASLEACCTASARDSPPARNKREG